VAVRDIVPVAGASFEETLALASPDLLREMIKGFAQRMMDAEVEALCGAGYGEVAPGRVTSSRPWPTCTAVLGMPAGPDSWARLLQASGR